MELSFQRQNICSVDVNDLDGDPSIELHNLPYDIPGYEPSMPVRVEYCDGLLIYFTFYGTGICNPWLRQIKWIKAKCHADEFNGMGYENSRVLDNKQYKILESDIYSNTSMKVSITDFGYDDAWKSYEFASINWKLYSSQNSVSLNGTLYWVAIYYHDCEPHELFIQSFDFSTERFAPYCMLPSENKAGPYDARSLAVFRGDGFSFLEQNYETRDIKIWVTKEKIQNGINGKNVEWMSFMNVSIPEWSSLKGKTCIYIANKGVNKFYEIKINDLVETHRIHRTYFPSLIQVPTFTMSGKEGKTESRFVLPRGVEASYGVGGKEWDDGFFNAVKKISVARSNFVVVEEPDEVDTEGIVTYMYLLNSFVGSIIPNGSIVFGEYRTKWSLFPWTHFSFFLFS
ncbi:LOW QUALITY PROTEIN: jacalin-related lectin 38 [Eutrema salsugineum]|uniref:LOW QUALITY PROTEIN: jacalin-related lectin 38 n=1 Tax=Eutrema salsugineum TaxID=72664 RepID=UPI000CED0A1A|nr:LOW QUALITY PROTEIN: jacalin-related lectin 38 [Eutrema salsugineum]